MTLLRDWFSLIGSTLRFKGTRLRALFRLVPDIGRRPCLSDFNGLCAHLRQARLNLDPASKDLEARFLATSTELEKLTQFSGDFEHQVEKLVCLASGNEGAGALLTGAVRIIEQSTHFLERCQEQTTRLLEQLRNYHAQIDQLLGVEAELQHTIAPLKFVQVLFKSECAPLGSAVQKMFDALTQEMETLHGKVREIFGSKFQQLDQTRQIIRRVIEKLEVQGNRPATPSYAEG